MNRPGEGSSPDQGRGGSGAPLATAAGWVVLPLDWSARIVAAGCLSFMFGALLLNVVLRYAFGTGITWAYEIHALLLPWLVGAGIVIAAARMRHIEVSLIADLLPPHARLAVALLVQALLVAICVAILWTSQPILRAAQFQTLSTLGVKQVWGYASLVYAFGAMGLIAAAHLVILLTRRGNLPGADSPRSLS